MKPVWMGSLQPYLSASDDPVDPMTDEMSLFLARPEGTRFRDGQYASARVAFFAVLSPAIVLAAMFTRR